MKTVTLLAVVAALIPQAINPSPRELLKVAHPLTIREIAAVLGAARKAMTAKTVRVSSLLGGQGADVLIGPGGRPKIIRTTSGIDGGIVVRGGSGSVTSPAEARWHQDIIKIVDYTGRPARHCDGAVEPGEMAIEYVRRSSTQAWTATARRLEPRDAGGIVAPAFQMLQGGGANRRSAAIQHRT